MMTFPNPFNIMFPGAGGNLQTFDFWSPRVSVNFAGNAAIEREVNEDVASYGRQIGWLNDIVLALAAGTPDSVTRDPAAQDSLNKLRDAQKAIEAIKERRKTSARDAAHNALAKFGAADRDGYRRFVRSLDPEQPPDAA